MKAFFANILYIIDVIMSHELYRTIELTSFSFSATLTFSPCVINV